MLDAETSKWSVNKDCNPKVSRVRAWFLGCLLLAAGVFVFTLIWSSTMEFWDLGAVGILFFGLPWAIASVLGVSLVSLAIGWFVARSNLPKRKQRLLLLTPWILATACWVGGAAVSAMPRSRFASVVGRPMPTSVQDVKAAGLNSFLASRWLLTFRIDPAQIRAIVARHSLAETNYFNLQDMIERDAFLKRISWPRKVERDTNAVFYARTDWGPPSRWVYFMVETNSSRAWFITGFQN